MKYLRGFFSESFCSFKDKLFNLGEKITFPRKTVGNLVLMYYQITPNWNNPPPLYMQVAQQLKDRDIGRASQNGYPLGSRGGGNLDNKTRFLGSKIHVQNIFLFFFFFF